MFEFHRVDYMNIASISVLSLTLFRLNACQETFALELQMHTHTAVHYHINLIYARERLS